MGGRFFHLARAAGARIRRRWSPARLRRALASRNLLGRAWTPDSVDTTFTDTGTAFRFEIGGGAGFGWIYQAFPTVIGASYRVTARVLPETTTAFPFIGKADDSAFSVNVVNTPIVAGEVDATFVATAGTSYIIIEQEGSDGEFMLVDDGIAVRLVA